MQFDKDVAFWRPGCLILPDLFDCRLKDFLGVECSSFRVSGVHANEISRDPD
jgi:hypothetical protein